MAKLYAVRKHYENATSRVRYYETRERAEKAHNVFSRTIERSELFVLNGADEWTFVKAYDQA